MKPTNNDCDTFEMHHAMGSIDCQGEEGRGHNPKPASQVNGCQSPVWLTLVHGPDGALLDAVPGKYLKAETVSRWHYKPWMPWKPELEAFALMPGHRIEHVDLCELLHSHARLSAEVDTLRRELQAPTQDTKPELLPPGRYRDTDGTEGTLSEFDAFANRYTFAPDGTKPPAVIGPGVPYPYRHLGRAAAQRLVPLDADGATVVVSAGPHLWETGELPSDPEEATRAVLDLIRQERERQVSVEGWDPSHDDEHADGALGAAAACYADPNPLLQVLDDGRVVRTQANEDVQQVPVQWPWAPEWWKPTPDDRERELVKAGALIVAELERLRRARPTVGTDDLPDGMAAVVAELERLEQAGDDTPSLPDKLTFWVKVPVFDPLDYVVASDPEEPVRGPNGGQVESQHGPCDSGGMTVMDFLVSKEGDTLLQDIHQLAFVLERLKVGHAKYGQPLRMDWPRAAEARDEELADAIAYSVAMRDTETAQALALLWAGASEKPTLLAVQGQNQPGWWREALGELEHAAVQAALEEHGPALDVACAFVVRALEAGKARPGDLKAHDDALHALFDAVDDWDPDARVCEGCPNLATTSDADGIPLCPECVALQVEHEAREGG